MTGSSSEKASGFPQWYRLPSEDTTALEKLPHATCGGCNAERRGKETKEGREGGDRGPIAEDPTEGFKRVMMPKAPTQAAAAAAQPTPQAPFGWLATKKGVPMPHKLLPAAAKES